MRSIIVALVVCTALSVCRVSYGGGGPANVLVVYNADDPDAVDVASYYAVARSIPDDRLCGVTGVDPSARTMAFDDFDSLIRTTMDGCLDALADETEIDYVVIVRGLPYRVDITDGFSTSLSAMIQVGHASDGAAVELAGSPQTWDAGGYWVASVYNPGYIAGSPWTGDYTITNPYSSWYTSAPGIVRMTEIPPSFRRVDAGSSGGWDFSGELFVVTRLDGFDYQDARDLVDRAVAADGSFPVAPLMCMEGSDQARAARDPECEFVVRKLTEAGIASEWVTPFDGSLSGHTVSAYFTGTAGLRDAIAGNTYVPGAVACNLTSTGAAPGNFHCSTDGLTCPGSESQTSIARFVEAGATAAHGTVAEPLNNTFPNASALLLYTFGYNIGESFLMAQRFVYWQNILLGDPLTTTWAERPQVVIGSIAEHPSASPLEISATHPDSVARVMLYIDGLRVAEADSDFLSHVVDLPAGSTIEVLAVAVAANVTAQRTGWPSATPLVQADVQGWASASLTVLDPVEPSPDGVIEPLPEEQPDDPLAEEVPDEFEDVSTDPDQEGDEPASTTGCGCALVV